MSALARLEIRPVRPEDEPFLAELFAATERERLSLTGADPELLAALIRHELAGQQRHYRGLDEDARHCILLAAGHPAGRMVLWENRDEIRLAELAVAPAFRGLGIGSAVIETLKVRARSTRRPLRLHVEKYDFRQPRRFYQRLGFHLVEDRRTHWFLEWHPARAAVENGPGQLKMAS